LSEWLLLLEAWWMLLIFYLALGWLSYDRLTIPAPLVNKKCAASFDDLVFAQRLQRLVGSASRLHLLSMTCLVQALSLRWMLSRRGIPAQLRLGVQKKLIGIHAHAWVELMEEPLGEENITERFHVLEPLERSHR
jgi:hypothetical protein